MSNANPSYDPIANEYAEFVNDYHDLTKVGGIATQRLLAAVERFLGGLNEQIILDLGCGEGHLARRLATYCDQVIGVDISGRLLDIALTRTQSENVMYLLDDAQVLGKLSDDSVDTVVSNLALMDIPDLGTTMRAVRRVLKPHGFFIFSLTHPCFQSPHTKILHDESGIAVGRKIVQYAKEGFWRSDNPNGIRGRVGAYHRTLSTYLNTLLSTGFSLRYIEEPTLQDANDELVHHQVQRELPSVMVMVAQLLLYPTLPNVP